MGRTGARRTPEAGRGGSSRGGVGAGKLALPSETNGDAARMGELTIGDREPGPTSAPTPRDFANKEFAPPKGTPAAVPAAGTPNAPPVASALPSPASAVLPTRARAMRNLLSAPLGAAFSAPEAPPKLITPDESAPSAGFRRTVGARMVGVGRRGGGAALDEPDVPNSGAGASVLCQMGQRGTSLHALSLPPSAPYLPSHTHITSLHVHNTSTRTALPSLSASFAPYLE
jgi:hypothetical protein